MLAPPAADSVPQPASKFESPSVYRRRLFLEQLVTLFPFADTTFCESPAGLTPTVSPPPMSPVQLSRSSRELPSFTVDLNGVPQGDGCLQVQNGEAGERVLSRASSLRRSKNRSKRSTSRRSSRRRQPAAAEKSSPGSPNRLAVPRSVSQQQQLSVSTCTGNELAIENPNAFFDAPEPPTTPTPETEISIRLERHSAPRTDTRRSISGGQLSTMECSDYSLANDRADGWDADNMDARFHNGQVAVDEIRVVRTFVERLREVRKMKEAAAAALAASKKTAAATGGDFGVSMRNRKRTPFGLLHRRVKRKRGLREMLQSMQKRLCSWKCPTCWTHVQRAAAFVVLDPFADLFIIICIVLNTLVMAIEPPPALLQNQDHNDAADTEATFRQFNLVSSVSYSYCTVLEVCG